jgi:hypothetical protein
MKPGSSAEIAFKGFYYGIGKEQDENDIQRNYGNQLFVGDPGVLFPDQENDRDPDDQMHKRQKIHPIAPFRDNKTMMKISKGKNTRAGQAFANGEEARLFFVTYFGDHHLSIRIFPEGLLRRPFPKFA